MDHNSIQMFFALLRSAVHGTKLSQHERGGCSDEQLRALLNLSVKQDVAHLLVLGLKQNGLISKENKQIEGHIFKAAFRYERLNCEYEALCTTLEQAKIPFLPLKGAVLRNYYPEAWMRTSCDIDVLVHREDLDAAISCLSKKLQCVEKERTTHDVSLFSPRGIHIELHFDLVEEGRAKDAIAVLSHVWENVFLKKDCESWYEMSDTFFYFYHIAHMAKHFEGGGCGVRPFIDLWILDHMEGADLRSRDELLVKGGLLKFASVCRDLSNAWFGQGKLNSVTFQMQEFLLRSGIYGSTDNRVLLQQRKKGGRIGFFFSRMFIPYSKLKRYYPILEKHPYLMPVMQIRRWFMLLNPNIAAMAKREMKVNRKLDKSVSDKMSAFLDCIGL